MRDNLEIAENQLDRTLELFSRLDARFSTLIAINSGQWAIIALNMRFEDLDKWYIAVPAGLFGITNIATFVYLFLCGIPQLRGGGGESIYYFATIAQRTESGYIKVYQDYTEEERIGDALSQVWRNSEIAAAKFRYLRWATILIVVAAGPWSATLLALGLVHHTIPVLKIG